MHLWTRKYHRVCTASCHGFESASCQTNHCRWLWRICGRNPTTLWTTERWSTTVTSMTSTAALQIYTARSSVSWISSSIGFKVHQDQCCCFGNSKSNLPSYNAVFRLFTPRMFPTARSSYRRIKWQHRWQLPCSKLRNLILVWCLQLLGCTWHCIKRRTNGILKVSHEKNAAGKPVNYARKQSRVGCASLYMFPKMGQTCFLWFQSCLQSIHMHESNSINSLLRNV